MDFKPLSSFFKKYNNLPTPKRFLKEALEEFIGFKGKIYDVSLKNSVLFVKTEPLIKQEFFLKKQKLLIFLKEKKLGVNITDIH